MSFACIQPSELSHVIFTSDVAKLENQAFGAIQALKRLVFELQFGLKSSTFELEKLDF